MPMESYRYMPMKALKDLVIEVTLNRYAFFTSGGTLDFDDAVIDGTDKLSWNKAGGP